ncbi:MAG: TlpA disulfide reductase family protein [Bacteroidales bacterium]|nr:TlpA disulfide reductase family protein [Bacteroidales bacterium]
MKKNMLAMATAAVATSLWATPYKVLAPMPEDAEGAMAFLINYDTSDKIDSVLVADGAAVFKGEIDEPVPARILVDGARYAQLILEPGSIAIDARSRKAFGSELNDVYNAIGDSVSTIAQAFQTASTDADKEAAYARYQAYMKDQMQQNLDNPIGYLIFIQQAYDMAPAELVAYLDKEPSLKQYKRIAKLVEMNERKAASQPGAKYIDFDINGRKLSDYVGRDGKYLLVDFWASWCGPCIRETAVLKDLYKEYKDKGLEVLGVAVWDEPDATRAAIEKHELPWPCIINAQSVPTDLYGISGIPCIMLIAPDGTILSRDKQDDDLRADVAKYLGDKQ